MTIKITTDSTCDLSPEQLAAHNIDVMPLTIIKGGGSFLDGVDISPEDIYSHVAAGGEITTTAALNMQDYHRRFSRLSPLHRAVIHINLGAEFSSCYQNASLAASPFSNVYVVDSRNISSGHGHVVLEAVRLAESGVEPEEIAGRLNSFTERVEATFLLNQLDYLRKGGRCSTVAALGANLLHLKPCIEVCDGRMQVGKKYRGSYEKVLREYVRDRLEGRCDYDPARVIVVHTACPPELVEMVCRDVERYTGAPPLSRPSAGCTIASHCGPSTLGIMFVRR